MELAEIDQSHRKTENMLGVTSCTLRFSSRDKEAKGWMGSQVVFPRGKQLHVMHKRHQSKPSLKDHDSSPSQVLCSPASFLFLVMTFSSIQT